MRGRPVLAAVLVAALAAGEPPAVPPPPPLPDGVAALLDRADQDLVRERARYDAAARKIVDRLAADLKREVERATRAGNLALALAIQARLDDVAGGGFRMDIEDRAAADGDLLGERHPLRLERSALPLGGTLARERGDIVLRGPGTGDVQNCVAVLPRPLPVGGVVRGTLLAQHKWCGLAIAATAKGDRYLSLYNEPGGNCSLFSHTGAARTREAVPIQVAMPIGQPVQFSITRKGKDAWEVAIGATVQRIDTATGGDCWGLTTYAGGAISLRLE